MNEYEPRFLNEFRQELDEELTSGILPYWINNTVDHQHGGFYGRVTFENIPVKDAEKGSILTARILWTFSACYRRFQNPEYKKIADHGYQFLTEVLWDEVHNGVYWMVDVHGNPTDDRKHVYAQAFTIYALAEYFKAFRDNSAIELAKELYQLVESKCADTKNGGYFEAFSRDWNLLDDVRLSEVDRNEPKSMNTHLHMLEAYTNLYSCWKSPELKDRLTALLNVFLDHILNEEKNSLIKFMGEDWTPRSEEVSFGHDIEASWLLIEAAEIIEDYPRYHELTEVCLNLVDQVKQNGLDKQYGGIFNEAGPENLIDDNKDWWQQAEAVVGFMNAFEISGNEEYLHLAYNTWEFIKKYMIDQKHGEWHEKVNRTGQPFHLDKVRAWKCPYHNGRFVIEMMHRIENLKETQV